MFDCVIFDFDGVLTDSEPIHFAAFNAALAPLGMETTWGDYEAHYVGCDDRDAIQGRFLDLRQTLEAGQLDSLMKAKVDAFERLVKASDLKPFPGVVELLACLRKDGVPTGLCTGSTRRDVAAMLAKMVLTDAFDYTITADEAGVGKPDPTGYQMTLQGLQRIYPDRTLRMEQSLAIEDSLRGLQAARRAGMKVAALPNTHVKEPVRFADYVLPSLEEITPRELRNLFEMN